MQTLTAAGLGRYMKKHQRQVVVSKRDENCVDKTMVSLQGGPAFWEPGNVWCLHGASAQILKGGRIDLQGRIPAVVQFRG